MLGTIETSLATFEKKSPGIHYKGFRDSVHFQINIKNAYYYQLP